MDDIHVMIRSGELLKYAKTIFGDLVVNAWVANDVEIEARETFKRIKLHCNGTLEYSNSEIVFEFSNGKRVSFSNSEWAFISIAGENYIEVDDGQ